ncbi:class I SAM-dependent methyltransferase [Candidatus Poribacteria bacterium]|nr:class I SAM-dependent methyltransferase [Candidatus Poribacteria bacterium]
MEKSKITKWHHAYIQNAYQELEQGYTKVQIDRLNINAKNSKVLDVGCGPGNMLTALSDDNPKLLIGVDTDKIFLQYAHDKNESILEHTTTHPNFIQGTLPTLPFQDETFDIVTCFLVMPHVPDDEIALTELTRVLKSGGTLAISGHGIGFPIRYLKRFKFKPLKMYLASFIYLLTGKKLIKNTLQNPRQICKILNQLGMKIKVQVNKRVFGCIATYWINATKREVIPKATQ